MTHFGGMWLIQRFCNKLGLKKLLQGYVRPSQGHSQYRPSELVLALLYAVIMGLRRINKTISLIPEDHLHEGGVTLRNVDVLVISPSEDLEKIAARHAHHLPWTIRSLLYSLGAFNRKGSNLISYLLFEKPFCRDLINLGYKDAMRRKEEILRFLEMSSA